MSMCEAPQAGVKAAADLCSSGNFVTNVLEYLQTTTGNEVDTAFLIKRK